MFAALSAITHPTGPAPIINKSGVFKFFHFYLILRLLYIKNDFLQKEINNCLLLLFFSY